MRIYVVSSEIVHFCAGTLRIQEPFAVLPCTRIAKPHQSDYALEAALCTLETPVHAVPRSQAACAC